MLACHQQNECSLQIQKTQNPEHTNTVINTYSLQCLKNIGTINIQAQKLQKPTRTHIMQH